MSGFTTLSINRQPDGKHADAGCSGLYLRVRGGSRSWEMRFSRDGKAHYLSLGTVASVKLAEARNKVIEIKAGLLKGINPCAAPEAGAAPVSTFKRDAEIYFNHMKGTWSEKGGADWLPSLRRHAFAIIGDRDTASLTVKDIVAVLDQIDEETGKSFWEAKNVTAGRIAARISATINHAIDRDDDGRYDNFTNPADRALGRMQKGHAVATVPHASIPWADMPKFYQSLAALDTMPAKALRFLVLCCTPRTGEVFGARWDEIEAERFNVPADRMKGQKDKRKARTIPLSKAAQALLATMGDDHTGMIFKGGMKNGELHHNSMLAVLQTLAPGFDVHGLRASFKTWVSENTKLITDDNASEIALGHVLTRNKSKAAYDRAIMIEERRELAERWASFLGA